MHNEWGEGVWQSFVGEDELSFNELDANGKPITTKRRMTLGEYVQFVLAKDDEYNNFRSEEDNKKAKGLSKLDEEAKEEDEQLKELPGFSEGLPKDKNEIKRQITEAELERAALINSVDRLQRRVEEGERIYGDAEKIGFKIYEKKSEGEIESEMRAKFVEYGEEYLDSQRKVLRASNAIAVDDKHKYSDFLNVLEKEQQR